MTGITVDSRAVTAGVLFAALPGARMHGAEFIGPALRMGAAAILTDAAGAKLAADVLAGSDAALVVADPLVGEERPWVTGANETDYHVRHAVLGRRISG